MYMLGILLWEMLLFHPVSSKEAFKYQVSRDGNGIPVCSLEAPDRTIHRIRSAVVCSGFCSLDMECNEINFNSNTGVCQLFHESSSSMEKVSIPKCKHYTKQRIETTTDKSTSTTNVLTTSSAVDPTNAATTKLASTDAQTKTTTTTTTTPSTISSTTATKNIPPSTTSIVTTTTSPVMQTTRSTTTNASSTAITIGLTTSSAVHQTNAATTKHTSTDVQTKTTTTPLKISSSTPAPTTTKIPSSTLKPTTRAATTTLVMQTTKATTIKPTTRAATTTLVMQTTKATTIKTTTRAATTTVVMQTTTANTIQTTAGTAIQSTGPTGLPYPTSGLVQQPSTSILMQNNVNTPNAFNRPWLDFKNGFGDSNGNYWIGNDAINNYRIGHQYQLYIYVYPLYDAYPYLAIYQWNFYVGESASNYQLGIGMSGGNATSDGMGPMTNQKFSTFDKDNDVDPHNCAAIYGAGWWYGGNPMSNGYQCGPTMLNGCGSNFVWAQDTTLTLRASQMWLVY